VRRWRLDCSGCRASAPGDALASVCPSCGQPWLVVHEGTAPRRDALGARWDMWRYADALPLRDGEAPVSLGEGDTPLLDAPRLARAAGVRRLLVKDESVNPTASFKARGMSAAVTRARALGVPGLVVPTAGNAGAALAAYGAAAGLPVRVHAPASTPPAILATIRAFGAQLELVDGHIGDAGRRAREDAAAHGLFDVSTLREPYRIEGKKTLGLEIAEQLGWRLPDVVVYPTGGGTGLIGMWKAFDEMARWGWLESGARPRMIVAQAEGCAPIVRAVGAGATTTNHQEGARPISNGTGSAKSQPATSSRRRPRRSASSPAARFVIAFAAPKATTKARIAALERSPKSSFPTSGNTLRSSPTMPPTSAFSPTSRANWPAFARRPSCTALITREPRSRRSGWQRQSHPARPAGEACR
jgi:threonine synthase